MNKFSKRVSKLVASVFTLTILMSMFAGMSFAATGPLTVSFDVSDLTYRDTTVTISDITINAAEHNGDSWLSLVPDHQALGLTPNAYAGINWYLGGSLLDNSDVIDYASLVDGVAITLEASGTLSSYPIDFYYGNFPGQTAEALISNSPPFEVGSTTNFVAGLGVFYPTVPNPTTHEILWTTDLEGDNPISSDPTAFVINPGDVVEESGVKAVKLYAHLVEKPYYTVSFDANGGTFVRMPEVSTSKAGLNAVMPGWGTITKEGHRLEGWALSPTGTIIVHAGNDYTINSAHADADNNIKLYAIWQQYTEFGVFYNLNINGQFIPHSPIETINGGEHTLLELPDIPGAEVYSRKTFMHWYNETTNTIHYPGDTITINQEVILTAVYRSVVINDNETYNKRTGKPFTMTFDVPFTLYRPEGTNVTEAQVKLTDPNGNTKVLEENVDFVASEGSIVLTFAQSFMTNLGLGSYKVELSLFNGESAFANFIVADFDPTSDPGTNATVSQEGGSPQTSDNSYLFILLGAMFVATIGFVAMNKKRQTSK